MKSLPSFDGTTSGFFSSYISSDWLSGKDIFSLICRLPGRCCPLFFLLLDVRSFKRAITPIMTHTKAVRMPTRMPNDRIGDKSYCSEVPAQETEKKSWIFLWFFFFFNNFHMSKNILLIIELYFNLLLTSLFLSSF